MKHKVIVPIAAALGLAFSFFLIINLPQPVDASTITFGPYLQRATSTATASITTSTRLLATTTGDGGYNRIFATICNPNATPVAISLNADAPATYANATVFIAAAAGYNACYEINDRNPYSGSVTASSTVGAVNVTYQQFVN